MAGQTRLAAALFVIFIFLLLLALHPVLAFLVFVCFCTWRLARTLSRWLSRPSNSETSAVKAKGIRWRRWAIGIVAVPVVGVIGLFTTVIVLMQAGVIERPVPKTPAVQIATTVEVAPVVTPWNALKASTDQPSVEWAGSHSCDQNQLLSDANLAALLVLCPEGVSSTDGDTRQIFRQRDGKVVLTYRDSTTAAKTREAQRRADYAAQEARRPKTKDVDAATLGASAVVIECSQMNTLQLMANYSVCQAAARHINGR